MPEPDHLYLGTRLTPAAYYRERAQSYANPHADGIARVLEALGPRLWGHVLDWGCGDGLATKLLGVEAPITGFVGVDSAPKMVARYVQETGHPGLVAGFGEPLPACDSAVASYALHLATPAETAVMWWRLAEAGARVLVVVTPFKARPTAPQHYFEECERTQGTWGPAGKTIYGIAYQRREDL